MKSLLAENWRQISPEEKVGVRQYCCEYLANPQIVLTRDKSVVRMMMLLLAKITKLGWFDDPQIKNAIVPDLTAILQSGNPQHKLIGLQAIQELIVEMTYMTTMKNLQVNRRTSLNFRDTALYSIYRNNI